MFSLIKMISLLIEKSLKVSARSCKSELLACIRLGVFSDSYIDF